jgi:rSAM/selenodomain-associated transferase 1
MDARLRRIALCIVAKAPAAGQVKTRLCPPLSLDEAARLYQCFLEDKIAQVLGIHGVEPVLAYAPDDAAAIFEALAPGVTLVPQGGGDLTSRLVSVLERLFESGFDAAMVIDSDTLTLPSGLLDHAVALLDSGEPDLVLGPSEDGGYYLIGLRRVHRALFDGMPWSTPAVLEETIRRARRLGLRVARLAPWYDVDTGEDLARLMSELEDDAPRPPIHTRRLLLSMGRTFVSGGGV